MRLTSDTVDAASLGADERDQMFALMRRCYDNTKREAFERDLEAKQWVLRVFEPTSRRLVGFSTQVMLSAWVDGAMIRALYSGDTVVDPAYWGDPALASAWGNFALRIIDDGDPSPLYWFLTSKGFRTYRYLPLFFKHYGPGHDRLLSNLDKTVLSTLGKLIAPHQFDAEHGILRASGLKDRVRPTLGSPQNRASHDPHVRFFLQSNPEHARGDELCCVAPLSRENFTQAAWRVINLSATSRAHST